MRCYEDNPYTYIYTCTNLPGAVQQVRLQQGALPGLAGLEQPLVGHDLSQSKNHIKSHFPKVSI